MQPAWTFALVVGVVSAASLDEPHFHRGKLAPYQLGKPNLLISSADEQRLRQGESVMQAVASADGSRRMVAVQDIDVPVHVVMGRITDLERYDKMVQGVDSCVNYVSNEDGGVHTYKSEYKIHAGGLKFTYYMEHRSAAPSATRPLARDVFSGAAPCCRPLRPGAITARTRRCSLTRCGAAWRRCDMAQNCMVFNLDYDRRSDLDDSVGYWFAQPTGPASCRVFYSCEVKLRGWVPGPVYNVLTKQALKQATTWVSSEATKEWALIQNGCSPQQRFTRFVSNVRTRMDNLRLEPPRVQLPDRFLTTGRRAVQFVSSMAQPKYVPSV